MSDFTYSGSPSADDPVGIIRLNIGDTDEDDFSLKDSEIQFAIDLSPGSLRFAAAAACAFIVSKLSARDIDTKIGQTDVKYSQRVAFYRKLHTDLIGGKYGMFPDEDTVPGRVAPSAIFVGGTWTEKNRYYNDENMVQHDFRIGQDDICKNTGRYRK